MEMNNDKKEGGSSEKVEKKLTNNEGKKSKRFDRKTKHKMRLEKKVKKEESEYVDFRKGLKSEKFESYYQVKISNSLGTAKTLFSRRKRILRLR